MNFFAHQADARAKTRRMIWLFALAVVAVVVAINVVVLLVFGIGVSETADEGMLPFTMIASTVITLAVIGLGSLFKTMSLRAGGGQVARSLGATLVPEDPRDFHLKRLRNVVEEMSIASGIPVPEIYVLEREGGINAFAAGYSPSDAAIAVTRGALDKLSRDELQGVIAHEYSHILNGDMRLNIRIMGLIFGLLVLGLTGRKVLEHMRLGGSRKEGNALLLVALAVMVFGYLGVFSGRLIKAYVSRQREYLADASAVQFTRLSHGLSGALMKIGAFQAGSKLTETEGEEVAHMLFGDGIGYSSLTATHPPLADRIKRIDPRFNPAQLVQLSQLESRYAKLPRNAEPPAASAMFASAPDAFLDTTAAPAEVAAEQAAVRAPSPDQVIERVANPGVAHVDYALAMRRSLPPILSTAAHMRERAAHLLFALVLARDSASREAHLAQIAQDLGSDQAEGSAELMDLAAQLHPSQRLPLAQLALPALKRRPTAELRSIAQTLDTLAHSDGHIDVFEYALITLVRQQVQESLEPGRRPKAKLKLPEVRNDVSHLLAVLAHHGHQDADSARRAFMAGASVAFPGDAPAYATPVEWISALDAAWPRLDAMLPAAKETLVMALASCVGHDGRLATEESELLRLVCSLLHCPLPPILKDP